MKSKKPILVGRKRKELKLTFTRVQLSEKENNERIERLARQIWRIAQEANFKP